MAKYTIKLTQEEISELKAIVSKGFHSSQSYRAAYVLLNSDSGNFQLGKVGKKIKAGYETKYAALNGNAVCIADEFV